MKRNTEDNRKSSRTQKQNKNGKKKPRVLGEVRLNERDEPTKII